MNKQEVSELKDVLRHARMINCQFDAPGSQGLNSVANEAYTAQVREQTRLWRETWIIPTLEKLIEKYDQ